MHSTESNMPKFAKFHAKHGPGFDCQLVSSTKCSAYRGRLPDEIIDEWHEHGWCGYSDGFLWTVDPDDFLDILDERHVVFMRTAFGSLVYWDGRAHKFDVMLGTSSPVFSRMSVLFDSMLCDDEYLEESLHYDWFQRALPALGRLKHDECYGFLPPIPMGGPGTLDTLKRVKLREHLAIVTQLFE